MPPADVLFHTGDFTNRGTHQEMANFNAWLGTLRARYEHIVVIIGNHEHNSGAGSDAKTVLTNAVVLDHELITINGLRIFGSPWTSGQSNSNPDKDRASDYFEHIPENVDVLLTHGPPRHIFDRLEFSSTWYGSSERLRKRIELVKPKAHLFGHVHEQRGLWVKQGGLFRGGVEYEYDVPSEAKPPQLPPPPTDYPCQLISCNAMKNHPGMERDGTARIAGPARLIVATKHHQHWCFVA
jgi:hypothetical protein